MLAQGSDPLEPLLRPSAAPASAGALASRGRRGARPLAAPRDLGGSLRFVPSPGAVGIVLAHGNDPLGSLARDAMGAAMGALRPPVTVLGSLNMDISVTVPQLPVPGATVLGSDARYSAGGKGANQAVAAVRLGARTCG